MMITKKLQTRWVAPAAALAAATGLALAGWANAQGTQADYERAAKLAERSRGKVFRDKITPNWLPEGRFWYRIETGPQAQQWVLVEPDGKLQRLDSKEQLSAAMGGTLGPASEQRLTDRPQPAESGEMVDLVFENQTKDEIALFWVNGKDRKPYGKLAPGAKRSQSTFIGHAWEVRDSSGKTLGYATATASA